MALHVLSFRAGCLPHAPSTPDSLITHTPPLKFASCLTQLTSLVRRPVPLSG